MRSLKKVGAKKNIYIFMSLDGDNMKSNYINQFINKRKPKIDF